VAETFLTLSPIERGFNRLLGFMVSLGIGPGYCHELLVRGRKSGRVYSTPVNMLEHDGKLWLVAPRGRTQWTHNAEAAGEVVLKRGSRRITYAIRATAPEERPVLLKLYLQTFASQVQRYFPVQPGAPVSEFAATASNYPVYELTPKPGV
jgi:deazaflavin-dependent oxidoreductase (nitroreductase family)